MLFKTFAASFSLLGLAVANPISIPDGTLHGLSVRQSGDICSKFDCGDACSGTIGSAAAGTSASGLQSRALTRPAEGELDAWFSNFYQGRVPTFSALNFFEEDGVTYQNYPSAFYPFDGTTAFEAGMGGLTGCTAVVVASEIGLYLGHVWEANDLTFYKKGDKSEFDANAVEGISKTLAGLGFNKNEQPNLQVKLVSKTYPAPEGETSNGGRGPVYPDALEELKLLISSYIPGLATTDIGVTQYHAYYSSTSDNNVAHGKIVTTFGVNANDDGTKGYELWVGSQYTDDGTLILSEDNNSPVMWAYWE